ncbi:MAG: MarR family transcriptional regulator [Proteobacteria bacterium]|nr:MarR family transcriptional regulator [Pseudomonadota bacterium]
MTDIKSGANPLFLREAELRQSMELLFYAYRDFTAEADQILAAYKFGRAHHRVLYFVSRYPEISVAQLLDILDITKQSLSRVLSQLIERGFIEQRTGVRDRRRRLLRLTAEGVALEQRLSQDQRRRIAEAYRRAGPEAVEGYRRVLLNMINEHDRARLEGTASDRRATG